MELFQTNYSAVQTSLKKATVSTWLLSFVCWSLYWNPMQLSGVYHKPLLGREATEKSAVFYNKKSFECNCRLHWTELRWLSSWSTYPPQLTEEVIRYGVTAAEENILDVVA